MFAGCYACCCCKAEFTGGVEVRDQPGEEGGGAKGKGQFRGALIYMIYIYDIYI